MLSGEHSSAKLAAEEQEGEGSGCCVAEIGMRGRVKHFTWAWFLSTMSTGGLSIALAETPHKFHGMCIYEQSRQPSLTCP